MTLVRRDIARGGGGGGGRVQFVFEILPGGFGVKFGEAEAWDKTIFAF